MLNCATTTTTFDLIVDLKSSGTPFQHERALDNNRAAIALFCPYCFGEVPEWTPPVQRILPELAAARVDRLAAEGYDQPELPADAVRN